MPITVSNNYINNSGGGSTPLPTNGETVKMSVSRHGGENASVNVAANVSSLKSGQTLSGEIVSKDGNNVTLKLSDGQLLNARLSGDSNLSLGKLLSFEVQNNESGTIALRPLFSNLAGTSTVGTALSAAFLPQTESYIKMTSAMMDAGMSIDRDSLLSMAKDVNSYPFSDPASIVEMTKLGLPIDELNVTQYENYKSFEHQVVNEINNLSDSLADGIVSLVSGDGQTENGVSLSNINELFKSINAELLDNEPGFFNGSSESEVLTDAVSTASDFTNAFSSLKNAAGAFFSAIRNAAYTQGASADGTVVNEAATGEAAQETEKAVLEEGILSGAEEAGEAGVNAENILDTASLLKSLSEASGINLPENPSAVETMAFLKDVFNKVSAGNLGGEAESLLKTELSELFNKNEVRNLLSDAIKSQMTLSPDKAINESEVKDLYSRILRISDKAAQFAQGREDFTQILQSANNLSDNVNFMNQLNHYVNYIQLPLKMNGENAHGELYVYSKHKNLKETDGNISALLHLDMDNLGPMDIYVSMNNYTNVSTNFKLSDVRTLDFIEKNIHLLDEALSKKGYNVTSSVSVSGKVTGSDSPITGEFFKKAPDDEGMKVISKLQFDVRA